MADSLIASKTGSQKGSQRDEFLDFALVGEEKPNSIDSEQSSIATDLIAYISTFNESFSIGHVMPDSQMLFAALLTRLLIHWSTSWCIFSFLLCILILEFHDAFQFICTWFLFVEQRSNQCNSIQHVRAQRAQAIYH